MICEDRCDDDEKENNVQERRKEDIIYDMAIDIDDISDIRP